MNFGIKNINDFANYKGNPCFVRCMGISSNFQTELKNMDSFSSQYAYKRISEFEKLSDFDKIEYYQKHIREFQEKYSVCKKMLMLFRQSYPQNNQTIEKNLLLSVMYWHDLYLKDLLNRKERKKFVCSGKISYKEYLFCYYSYLLGIDTMIILPESELNIVPLMLNQSQPFTAGSFRKTEIPKYQPNQPDLSEKIQPPNRSNLKLNIPPKQKQRKELSYEELARLAKSVVMIGVCNQKGEVIGSGSGIIVGRKGYILTNYHVVAKGFSYAVRIENDDRIHTAYNVIKYHSDFDMAVIKIDVQTEPLKVYSGNPELARGQKVVAIGSPMGLFNSVSDGIISGFRVMDEQEMIQFTAPISSGSSGGALLNLYGELIGMSTAEISDAQNMNFAVSYKNIIPFVRGFIN